MVAVDDDLDLGLSYCDSADQSGYAGIIESTVFAVGCNKEYIIAKQHPRNIRNITNYFILPIKDGSEPKNDDLIGPLTKEQFNEKRQELNIPNNLKFTIVKEDLK